MKNLTVSMSINTLDENIKNDMDNASSIKERWNVIIDNWNGPEIDTKANYAIL